MSIYLAACIIVFCVVPCIALAGLAVVEALQE